jgi:hypothetical protein
MRSLPVILSLAALVFACTKSEETGTGSSPSASSVPPPAVSSAPAASATAVATESAAATNTAPSGSGTTTNAKDAGPAAAPGGATDAGKATAAASGSAGGGGNASGAGECGTKPLPDCPLQAWMKANMNPPSLAGDTAALATALEKAASFAPPGYTNWTSISNDGAKAAKGGDLAAAKASCRSCHDQYKKKYQAEFRTRKI